MSSYQANSSDFTAGINQSVDGDWLLEDRIDMDEVRSEQAVSFYGNQQVFQSEAFGNEDHFTTAEGHTVSRTYLEVENDKSKKTFMRQIRYKF